MGLLLYIQMLRVYKQRKPIEYFAGFVYTFHSINTGLIKEIIKTTLEISY